MGLFDHLFKSRPDDSVERVVDAPLKASSLVRIAEGEGEAPPDPAAAFLQPKGYAPGASNPALGGQNQGFVPVLPAAKRAPPHERKVVPAEGPPSPAGEVVLTVGDVLQRIPISFLRPGPHDLKRELRFQIADLSSDITRGRPMIALSCIAEQCPELFHSPIGDDEDMAIRLPLQKLVEQVGRRAPAAPLPAAPPAARPPIAAPVEKVTVEPVVPAPLPTPVAEKAVPPVPPTPVEPPPVAPAPIPPAPVPEMIVPKPLEPPPMVEPEPAVKPEPVVKPESAVEIAAIIPEEPSAPPLPAPTPSRSAEPPGESTIELSFAAIAAGVPREILAGPLPHIAESYRISLPFPMIERQLGTGVVQITGKVFWSAIPPLLKHHFVHRDDIPVSIPLEEIFQNLPVGGTDEVRRIESMVASEPQPPVLETPIVLAPLAVPEATPDLDMELPLAPVAPIPAPVPEPVAKVAVEEPPAIPAPVPPNDAPALAATVPAETAPVSAASAAPGESGTFFVHLQPFRAFSPPSPAVEQEAEPTVPSGESVILGEAPAAPPPATEPSKILVPTDDIPVVAADHSPSPEAPQSEALPSAPPPAPEPAPIPPPTPEPIEAFNPDQPPPLKIEEPAAAVAILRATVPGPQEAAVFAAATVSVQPPKIFRPTVFAPPISGFIASAPVNLAPTLAGSAAIGADMISLAPAVETNTPAPQPPASAPAPPVVPAPVEAVAPPPAKTAEPPAPRDDPAPKRKKFVRQIFHLPTANPEPEIAASAPPSAVAETSPAPQPELPRKSPEASAFQLHLPPLPQAPEAPAAPEHAPPALPISRFDQHSLQSLFMTEEILDLPKVSRLAAALPGLQACVITTRGKTFTSGDLPEGFDVSTLRGLAPQVGAAADRLTIGELKNFTLYGQQYSISFFERPSVCLCAIHRARCFVPGVREKLVAVVDELARG